MMKNVIRMVMVAIFSIALGACGTPGGTRDGGAEVGDSSGMDTGADGAMGATTSGVAGMGEFAREALDDPASPLANRIIYFDYDKSEVKPEGMTLLEAHGMYLSMYPDVRITLEGHADERGSREYNIALGERRAQAVRRLLLLQGASDSQIDTVSYGEERPVALGHDDSSWERNRRVEIVYH